MGGESIHRIDNPDWDSIEQAIRKLGKHSYAMEPCHIAPTREQGLVEDPKYLWGFRAESRMPTRSLFMIPIASLHLLSLWSEQASAPDVDELPLDELPSATLDDAIQVARTFAIDGQLDSAFQWRSHPSS